MKINKQALSCFGITKGDYIAWCKDNDKNVNSRQSKKEFFEEIIKGNIEVKCADED